MEITWKFWSHIQTRIHQSMSLFCYENIRKRRQQSEMQLVEVLTEETQNTGVYTWGVDSTSNAHQKLSQYDRYRIQVHGVRYEPQWKRTFRCENKNVQQEDGGCLSPTFKMIKPNHLGNDDDVRLDVRLQRKNNLNHSGWSVVHQKEIIYEDVFSR